MWIDDNSKRIPVRIKPSSTQDGESPCSGCNSANYCENNHTACHSFLMYVRNWEGYKEAPEDRIPGRVKYNMIFTDKGGRADA